jgi:signal transduction histidine kinase
MLSPPLSDAAQRLAASTGALFGDAFVRRLLSALPEELAVRAAFVVDGGGRETRILTYYAARDEWHSVDEPREVLSGALGSDPSMNAQVLQSRYPVDFFAGEAEIAAAHVVPFHAPDGELRGYLGVLTGEPGSAAAAIVEVLQLVAPRAALELERSRAESELQAAVDEQAALRRIATFVAGGMPAEALRDVVTYEVALLFEAQSANIARFEDDGHVRVVGVWAEPGASTIARNVVLPLDGEIATAKVWRSNAPARVDSYDGVAGVFAAKLREHGINASISAPITVGGRAWGAITASKSSRKQFPEAAELRLGKFAELFALAIANAEAREELAVSRARLVEEALAERRRLERNLHDGAQQRLVALALTLRLAQNEVDGEAKELLAAASDELAVALAELRELARGIHPAVLTERGLVAAVESLVARAPLPVTVEASIGERPLAAVEAAAYYVVAEAVTNAVRYANASRVVVRARSTDGELRVEVEDDGVGGADASRGSGLAGLADRVAAAGGRLRVVSPAGEGTLVRAELPSRLRRP